MSKILGGTLGRDEDGGREPQNQNPIATTKLADSKKGEPAFNQRHLKSAKAKHLASNGQRIVRHPGADDNASASSGTLNQE